MTKSKPARFWSTACVVVVIIGLFGVMAARMVQGARSTSATTDEAIHILSGYLADKNGDYRLNPEHPFLGKMIAAAPHVLLRTPLPDLTKFYAVANSYYYDSWSETRSTANAWLYDSGVQPQSILWPSRIIAILATLALGLSITWWSAKRIGLLAGAIVATFFTLDPTLLAHGQLANTDVWALVGWTGVVLSFVDYVEKPSRRQLIWLAVWFGVAMNLKFSLILLIPTLVVGWVIARLVYKRPIASYGKAFLSLLLGWIAVTGLVYSRGLATVASAAMQSSLSSYVAFDRILPYIGWLIPAQYWKGLVMVLLGTVDGRPAYLLGHLGIGWWYYFPIAFLVKEPTVLVIGFILLVIIGSVRIRHWDVRGAMLAIALLIYWLAAMKSQLTLGIRHLAPVLPLTYVLLAGAITAVWQRARSSQRTAIAVTLMMAALVLWWSIEQSSPYYLPYFNEFIGGSVNGQRYLADSNLDWGQALPQISDWLRSNNVSEPILLDYQWTGSSAPRSYGIHSTALTNANQRSARLIAVSRSELVSNPSYEYLRLQKPTAIVANAIAIFDQRIR